MQFFSPRNMVNSKIEILLNIELLFQLCAFLLFAEVSLFIFLNFYYNISQLYQRYMPDFFCHTEINLKNLEISGTSLRVRLDKITDQVSSFLRFRAVEQSSSTKYLLATRAPRPCSIKNVLNYFQGFLTLFFTMYERGTWYVNIG